MSLFEYSFSELVQLILSYAYAIFWGWGLLYLALFSPFWYSFLGCFYTEKTYYTP